MSKPRIKRRIFEREAGKCYYCYKSLKIRGRIQDGKTVPSDTATLDHVIPKSFGKEFDKPWNLVLSCGKCNRRKDNKYPGLKDFVLVFKRKYRADLHSVWSAESLRQIKRNCSVCGRRKQKDPNCITCNKAYQDFVTRTTEYLRKRIW